DCLPVEVPFHGRTYVRPWAGQEKLCSDPVPGSDNLVNPRGSGPRNGGSSPPPGAIQAREISSVRAATQTSEAGYSHADGNDESRISARNMTRCRPVLASFASLLAMVPAPPAAAANIVRIDREVSIGVNRADGVFFGHVLSSRPGTCAEGARVYVLQKRHGPDKRL